MKATARSTGIIHSMRLMIYLSKVSPNAFLMLDTGTLSLPQSPASYSVILWRGVSRLFCQIDICEEQVADYLAIHACGLESLD